MDRARLKTVLSAAWVLLGTTQATAAFARDAVLFGALGVVYAATGLLYFWAEVYRLDGP